MNIDEWFAKVRSKYAAHMQCGKGCTACCHGLFDITLADAVEVARGFQRIVDGANNPPCPCLGDAGECLIYEHRPMACRLEGVPMVDVRDGLFGDWCELNFKDGIPETALRDLTQDYEGIETAQESRSDAVAERAGLPNPRAVTFIPSVIAEYDSFWRRLPSYSRGAGFAR
jgi:Fe-S-cluster containining protein